MAKSKEQKQLEAIQRKREGIDGWRGWYLKRDSADAKHHFEKMCREAQVDIHGNPLPGSPGYNDPGLLLDPKASVTVRVKGLYTERVVGSHRQQPEASTIMSREKSLIDIVDSTIMVSFTSAPKGPAKEFLVSREKHRELIAGDPILLEKFGDEPKNPVCSSGSFDRIKHNLDFDGDEPLIPLFSTEQIQKEIKRLREQAVLLRKAPYFNFDKATAFEAEATRIEKLL